MPRYRYMVYVDSDKDREETRLDIQRMLRILKRSDEVSNVEVD